MTEYFTPSIEDIRVGYEFEVFLKDPKNKEGSWKKRLYKDKWVDDNISFQWYLEQGKIRVPYLTKEQIEAEGWPVDKESGTFKKGDWEFDQLTLITDEKFCLFGFFRRKGVTSFAGQLKDINTFRYICKLLGI